MISSEQDREAEAGALTIHLMILLRAGKPVGMDLEYAGWSKPVGMDLEYVGWSRICCSPTYDSFGIPIQPGAVYLGDRKSVV